MRIDSKEFIALQIRFAERLVDLSGDDWSQVLASHTVFRQLLGTPFGADGLSDPRWVEFTDGIAQQSDRVNWAYDFYLQHHPSAPRTPDEARFGCFTFDYHFRPEIRLHFSNRTTESVLNRTSVSKRQAELKRLFAHIRDRYPEAERVRGGSWLYNIEAYRRLFPPVFVASAKPIGYETGFFSLWGQFLRADRSVRNDVAQPFLLCLATQTTVEGCQRCFPLEVLRTECPIEVFYRFYSTKTTGERQ